VQFLGEVAKLVAVAIENAMAFREIAQLKDKLAEERLYLESEIRTELTFEHIVGESPALRQTLQQVEIVAPTDSTVLLLGETGTGKELLARAIHDRSSRRDRTFVKLNCAAIPSGLLESELFGHEKGAFTGAIAQKIGRFQVADGGTLFLDEVGEIPLELQPKLLRVLQEQEFERIGGTKTVKVDVRIIAATNRDLAADVEAGRFRRDLYYRLAVYPITLPSLRERKEDLGDLATHLLGRICRRLRRPPVALTSEQVAVLALRDWPGNVRELLNFLERAVISSETPGPLRLPIDDERLPARPAFNRAATVVSVPAVEGPMFAAGAIAAGPAAIVPDFEMRRRERDNLARALERCHGKIYGPEGAAALLGLKPTTLASRLKRLQIRPR
jgi:formate hydrogenlyase transcriptional activator